MGLFKRSRDIATIPAPPEATLAANDVIPADSFANRLRTGGGFALERATDIYRKNPKTVGALAVLASALLLKRMKTR